MSHPRESIRAKAVTTFMSQGNRPGQEDHVLVDREKGIFVIADGFGGPTPGAAAAKSACEAIRSFLFKEARDLDATLPFVLRTYFSLAGNVLFNSLIYANRKVNALNKGKNVHEKGGASALAGFIDGELLALANVGVCSAWLLRDGKSVDLVMPRNFGKLCDPFALVSPDEHKVPLIALGLCDDLEPEIVEYRIRPGDWVIFNTDGIEPDMREAILAIQEKKLAPEASIKEVTNLMGSQTYRDNASISLIII
jgi:serine/threonine protein phosphatase PrpC